MPTALRQTRESLMHEECSRGWALKLGEFLGGGGVVKRRRRRGSTGILGGHEGAWRHMQGDAGAGIITRRPGIRHHTLGSASQGHSPKHTATLVGRREAHHNTT